MPSFAYVEPAYGFDDEHPGSGQSILVGQAQVAKMLTGTNGLMNSPAWKDSVFFLSYDEGGGPFDHVPPVPTHTNDFTSAAMVANYQTDISSIAVNADSYSPCPSDGPLGTGTQPTPTIHCDLETHVTWDDPGYLSSDAPSAPPAGEGFAAQLGFRLPNMVVSPFIKKHYVSHIPMDHTAVIRFVEDRFIGNQSNCGPQSYPINVNCYLTNRDAVQPQLLDFFDFVNEPWLIPPTQDPTQPPVPQPTADPTNALCTPGKMQ
jgi:phospholipase C